MTVQLLKSIGSKSHYIDYACRVFELGSELHELVKKIRQVRNQSSSTTRQEQATIALRTIKIISLGVILSSAHHIKNTSQDSSTSMQQSQDAARKMVDLAEKLRVDVPDVSKERNLLLHMSTATQIGNAVTNYIDRVQQLLRACLNYKAQNKRLFQAEIFNFASDTGLCLLEKRLNFLTLVFLLNLMTRFTQIFDTLSRAKCDINLNPDATLKLITTTLSTTGQTLRVIKAGRELELWLQIKKLFLFFSR